MKYNKTKQENYNMRKSFSRKLNSAGLAALVGISVISSGCVSNYVIENPNPAKFSRDSSGHTRYEGKKIECLVLERTGIAAYLPHNAKEAVGSCVTFTAGGLTGYGIAKATENSGEKENSGKSVNPVAAAQPASSSGGSSDSGESYQPPVQSTPGDSGPSAPADSGYVPGGGETD